MSENTVTFALRRRGCSGDEMTAHGFRAMAAPLLNEMGLWNPDAIERQLAHMENNGVRRAYARGQYWEERMRMMQHWSDYLDQLPGGDTGNSADEGNVVTVDVGAVSCCDNLRSGATRGGSRRVAEPTACYVRPKVASADRRCR